MMSPMNKISGRKSINSGASPSNKANTTRIKFNTTARGTKAVLVEEFFN